MRTRSLSAVSAGPLLPSEQHQDEFDIEEYLLRNHKGSFYIQVNGDSLIERGIVDGDILVIDKSAEPYNGGVVVAQIDGGYTLKIYDSSAGRLRLVPANKAHSPVKLSEGSVLCGVATFLIHRL